MPEYAELCHCGLGAAFVDRDPHLEVMVAKYLSTVILDDS